MGTFVPELGTAAGFRSGGRSFRPGTGDTLPRLGKGFAFFPHSVPASIPFQISEFRVFRGTAVALDGLARYGAVLVRGLGLSNGTRVTPG